MSGLAGELGCRGMGSAEGGGPRCRNGSSCLPEKRVAVSE